MNYQTVEVELAHKEMVDRNRRFLSNKEFNKALRKKRVTELIRTNSFHIQWGTSEKQYIDPTESIGIITAINTETNRATIRISDEVKKIFDDGDYVLVFGYMGGLEKNKEHESVNNIIDPTIINAGLLPRLLSAYQEAKDAKKED